MSWLNQSRLMRSMLLTVILLFSISCNFLTQATTPKATPVPKSSPTPAPGKITGRLIESDGRPTQGVILRLWRVGHAECPTDTNGWVQIEDSKIETKTDANGAFLIENAPPGCYLLEAKFSTGSLSPVTMLKNENGNISIHLMDAQTVDVGDITVKR